MELEKENKVITEFLQSLGPWNKSVVIGGGYALFVYKMYFADPYLYHFPLATRDIDSIIPRKIPIISKKNIAHHLIDAGFIPLFKDLDIPATESYVKEIDGLDIEIEFLTDSSIRNNKYKNISIAGVVAQPLDYLKLSLENTKEFSTYSGQTGRVVSPEAWIFHKGLTFTKRNNPLKTFKDLYGIWYAATQLGNFSTHTLDEFKSLVQKHSKWFVTFQKNLQKWRENASPSDWSKLEMQDPSGTLKKLNFEYVLEKLSTCQPI